MTGDETTTLADEIKKYNAEDLICFLRKEGNLELDENEEEIIRKEKIDGWAFLKSSKQDFRDYGMKGGPAIILADFAKECREKKLKPFSSYLSLSDVLSKYYPNSDGFIDSIPMFSLPAQEISGDNMHYKDCVKEILGRLRSYGPLQSDSSKAMRNEYVVAILHAGLHIVMDETNKKLNMRPQYGIVGEDSKGRIDYAINDDEDLICITEDEQHNIPIGIAQNIEQLESAYEMNKKKRKRGDDDFDYIYGVVTTGQDWQFLLYAPKTILKGSKLPYRIELTDDALIYDSVEYHSLCKDVKKILGIIVGLLKDRACVDNSPEAKRIKINSYLLKK